MSFHVNAAADLSGSHQEHLGAMGCLSAPCPRGCPRWSPVPRRSLGSCSCSSNERCDLECGFGKAVRCARTTPGAVLAWNGRRCGLWSCRKTAGQPPVASVPRHTTTDAGSQCLPFRCGMQRRKCCGSRAWSMTERRRHAPARHRAGRRRGGRNVGVRSLAGVGPARRQERHPHAVQCTRGTQAASGGRRDREGNGDSAGCVALPRQECRAGTRRVRAREAWASMRRDSAAGTMWGDGLHVTGKGAASSLRRFRPGDRRSCKLELERFEAATERSAVPRCAGPPHGASGPAGSGRTGAGAGSLVSREGCQRRGSAWHKRLRPTADAQRDAKPSDASDNSAALAAATTAAPKCGPRPGTPACISPLDPRRASPAGRRTRVTWRGPSPDAPHCASSC